jgi:hypothetical protein
MKGSSRAATTQIIPCFWRTRLALQESAEKNFYIFGQNLLTMSHAIAENVTCQPQLGGWFCRKIWGKFPAGYWRGIWCRNRWKQFVMGSESVFGLIHGLASSKNIASDFATGIYEK